MCSPCQEDMHRQAHQVTMAVEMTANGDEDKSMQKSTEGHDNDNSESHKEGKDNKGDKDGDKGDKGGCNNGKQ